MGPPTRDPGRLQEAAGSSVSLPASCFLLCGPERTPSEAEGTPRQPASMMDSAHKPQGQGPLGKPPRGSQGRGVPGPPHSGPAEGAGSSRPCCPRVIAATLCEGGRWARSRRVQSAPSSPATSRPLGFAHSPAAAAVGSGPEQAPARTLRPAWAAAGYHAPGAPGPSQVGGLGAFETRDPAGKCRARRPPCARWPPPRGSELPAPRCSISGSVSSSRPAVLGAASAH